MGRARKEKGQEQDEVWVIARLIKKRTAVGTAQEEKEEAIKEGKKNYN